MSCMVGQFSVQATHAHLNQYCFSSLDNNQSVEIFLSQVSARLSPGYSVLSLRVEEDGAVVLADLLPLPDVLDGLHHHMVLHVVTDDAGVARVVKQGQSGVNS